MLHHKHAGLWIYKNQNQQKRMHDLGYHELCDMKRPKNKNPVYHFPCKMKIFSFLFWMWFLDFPTNTIYRFFIWPQYVRLSQCHSQVWHTRCRVCTQDKYNCHMLSIWLATCPEDRETRNNIVSSEKYLQITLQYERRNKDFYDHVNHQF